MESYRKLYRIYLFVLVVWDFCLGAFLVLFAPHIANWVNLGQVTEPFFIRFSGVLIIVQSYIQWIQAKNLDSAAILDISLAFRWANPIFYVIEAFFLLPRPFGWFHWLILSLAGGDVAAGVLMLILARRASQARQQT